MKVLIADQDPVEVERLRRIVEDAGDEALTACTGAEALALIKTEGPNLVIHSTTLSDLPNVELLEQVRGDAEIAGTTVIVATTDTCDNLVFRAFSYRSDAILERPIEAHLLAAWLDRVRPHLAT